MSPKILTADRRVAPGKSSVLAAMALLAAFGAPALAWGQAKPPLADVARKEADRRKTTTDSKKVITTKDLPDSAKRSTAAGQAAPASEAGSATASGDPAQAGAAQKPASSAAPSDDAKGEEYWKNRMAGAREGLRRNEVFLDALRNRVAGLTADYSTNDPYERKQIGETRQKALDEMERLRADVELSKKQVADVEEEARKAGVPPGWVR